MKILFIEPSDLKDPNITLVRVDKDVTAEEMKVSELKQEGLKVNGGSWKLILDDLDIPFEVLEEATLRTRSLEKFDLSYPLNNPNE